MDDEAIAFGCILGGMVILIGCLYGYACWRKAIQPAHAT